MDKVLSERIAARIENYFSQSAAEVVMVGNKANAATLELACTIRY